MLKIYPTLVMPNTKLYTMWKNKEFDVYDDENYLILKNFTQKIPYWNRVMRVQRDIPINKMMRDQKLMLEN